MKINVSKNNQIVRFMQSMRKYSMKRDEPEFLPDDICSFTREFLISLFVFFGVSLGIGCILLSMLVTVLILVIGQVPEFEILYIVGGASMGFIFSLFLIFLYVTVDEKMNEKQIYPKRALKKKITDSLLWKMMESITRKICVKVEIN